MTHRGAAAPAPSAPATLPWIDLTEDDLHLLPDDGRAELRLRIRDVGVLRALTLAPGPRYLRVVVTLASWRAPTLGWRGSLGAVPGLTGVKVTWPASEKGRLTVAVDLAEPTPVATVARAIVPLVVPSRALPAFGSPEIAVDARGADSALALLSTPAARQVVPEPDVEALRGADLLLVDEVRPSEVLQVHEPATLLAAPVVDVLVHRPLGRRRPDPQDPQGLAALGSAALVETRDGWQVVRADGALVVDVPRDRPLREAHVRKLRPVGALSLADGVPEAPTAAFAARLVELAATGTVLHGGHGLSGVPGLDPELRDLMGTRAPTSVLELTLRSVEQVRRTLRAHSGLAARDRLSRSMGWGSAMPTVTAVLTSRRPDAALATLRALGAQSYEPFQIVLAMHGVPAPDLTGLDDRTRARIAHVVETGPEVPFGAVLARASAVADGELITKVDDDDLYGTEHVADLVRAYTWSGAQIVGKQAEYVHLERRDVTLHRTFRTETYARQVAGGAMMLSAADLAAVGGWRPVPRSVDRGLLLRVLQDGGVVYATRGPGFVYTRHDRGHTWLADDDHFDTRVLDEWNGLPPQLVEFEQQS
ncbi:hypothetical protein D1825_12850 [Cellulomonas rhizosphaerae]|uniref:Glycosyltransferase family 2 protein n=1 Tax=Cellulomonas rhizosphaerae TaxID=2293719 RepID=A0A413RJP2_9CELL|nr:hypothetical protein D1825_12850 [Cellulomonas rhizosphaerae]